MLCENFKKRNTVCLLNGARFEYENKSDAELAYFSAVLRIRIYYYADPDLDPGSKKCPYGSGS